MNLEPAKISQYVKDLGISYRDQSNSFVLTCPLCGGKDKLYIRKKDGKFICFKCGNENGFSGALEYAVAKLTNRPVKEIREELYGSKIQVKVAIDFSLKDFFNSEEGESEEEIEDLPTICWPYYALDITDPGAVKGANYLLGRGIPLDVASYYRIKYSAADQSVMFPVYVGDDLYGWQHRTIRDTRFVVDGEIKETIKAWSSNKFPRHSIVMFANNLTGSDHAIITEGPIDAIKCHLAKGNVATTGKVVTPSQISYIMRQGIKRVYFALDPDAYMELYPLMEQIDDEIEVFRVELPRARGKKVDLGSLTMEDAYGVIKNAQPALKRRAYFWLNDFFG